MRQAVPRTGDEKSTLVALLDVQRAVIRTKVDGLDDQTVRRQLVSSGTSLLAIVKHLGYVERWWFRIVFTGDDADYPASDDDPDADWRLDDRDTVGGVLAFYEDECERSRAVVAGAALDDLAARHERVSLRWILAHMLQETARHAGQADILRELIDGTCSY